MTTSRIELENTSGSLTQFCQEIQAEAENIAPGVNPFRERLLQYGIGFSNSLDAGEYRPEIPVLILKISPIELTILENNKNAIVNLIPVKERLTKKGSETKDAYNIVLGGLREDTREISDKLISMYNLCHFFANVAQRGTKERIESLRQIGNWAVSMEMWVLILHHM